MRVRLERDILVDAVLWAARSLPKNPSMPILAGLLITAKGNNIEFSSFDYETSARISVNAEIIEEGAALVSGKLLSDICSLLPTHFVELIVGTNEMELKCGSIRYTLQTLPVNEYPELPELPKATGKINSEEFAHAVSQVLVAAGKDAFLPIFTGIRVEINNDQISLLATDRYRMAVKDLDWQPENPNLSAGALVPAKILGEAAKAMVSGENLTISLSSEDGAGIIGFASETENGTREITTRLLEGDFPEVRHLMKVVPSVTVKANISELRDAVRRVSLVAERTSPIKMTIEDERVILEAATGDQAQALEFVDAVVTKHGELENQLSVTGFNPMYLRDALNSLNTAYVSFDFSSQGKPCLMLGMDDLDGAARQDYQHVVMLMRLDKF